MRELELSNERLRQDFKRSKRNSHEIKTDKYIQNGLRQSKSRAAGSCWIRQEKGSIHSKYSMKGEILMSHLKEECQLRIVVSVISLPFLYFVLD